MEVIKVLSNIMVSFLKTLGIFNNNQGDSIASNNIYLRMIQYVYIRNIICIYRDCKLGEKENQLPCTVNEEGATSERKKKRKDESDFQTRGRRYHWIEGGGTCTAIA
jgi:hypothetical protein